ncbi:MAG TPA: hypothetical protein VLA58_08455 [Chitinophagaceae bacterium]|nr:hypothetical protein [Chitinophagaceae bacterium]
MSDSSTNNEQSGAEERDDQAVKKVQGRILTFNDLLDEEQRLIMEVKRNKARIVEDFNIVKGKLQPANQALTFMSKLTGGQGQPGFVAHGVDIALDLLSKKYLFKRSNWFVTLAGSYLVRGLSQLFLSKTKSKPRGQRFGGNGIDQPIGDEMPNQ